MTAFRKGLLALAAIGALLTLTAVPSSASGRGNSARTYEVTVENLTLASTQPIVTHRQFRHALSETMRHRNRLAGPWPFDLIQLDGHVLTSGLEPESSGGALGRLPGACTASSVFNNTGSMDPGSDMVRYPCTVR